MASRSALGVCAGFVFWLALAYCYYARDLGAAFLLALFFVVGVAAYAWARRRPPKPVPPKSDLPSYKFDDVKPRDFE